MLFNPFISTSLLFPLNSFNLFNPGPNTSRPDSQNSSLPASIKESKRGTYNNRRWRARRMQVHCYQRRRQTPPNFDNKSNDPTSLFSSIFFTTPARSARDLAYCQIVGLPGGARGIKTAQRGRLGERTRSKNRRVGHD